MEVNEELKKENSKQIQQIEFLIELERDVLEMDRKFKKISGRFIIMNVTLLIFLVAINMIIGKSVNFLDIVTVCMIVCSLNQQISDFISRDRDMKNSEYKLKEFEMRLNKVKESVK